MKKLLLVTLMAISLIACSKENDGSVQVNTPEGTGIISLSVSPKIMVDGTRAQTNGVDLTQILDAEYLPESGDVFQLIITSDDPEISDVETTVASFNEKAKKTYFKAGQYVAVVKWGNPANEGQNLPCFKDATVVDVVARTKSDVNMRPALSNSIVKVEFSDAFKNYFANGAAITITSGNGNKWNVGYGIENGNADNNEDGTTPYIFVESGKTVKVSGSAIKQCPSATVEPEEVTFSSVDKALEACKVYVYKYDVTDAGSVTVQFTVTNDPEPEDIIEVGDFELNDDAIE